MQCTGRGQWFALHRLSCRQSAGRQLRHKLLNDIVQRALTSANIPAVLEPTGMFRGDGKRPDGMTLMHWARGRSLVWDATCPDTFAASHISQSSTEAGSAAAQAELKKQSKYDAIAQTHEFIPIAVETSGVWGEHGLNFVCDLGKRISNISGDQKATCYLKQRISMAIQHGNAIAILGTLPAGQSLELYSD